MSIFLLLIYLAIQHKDSLIFLELKERYSSRLWREINWKVPFHNFGFVGWLELYSSWILITLSDWLMLESLLFVLLPCGLGIFFRAKVLFEACYWFLVELLSVASLAWIPFLLLFLYDSWELQQVLWTPCLGGHCWFPFSCDIE